jgi:hypothetical protein
MSLRTKLITIFLALLTVFGAKSFYTSKSLDALGVLATDMYDGPVMSVNYVQISARNFSDANAFLGRTLQFDNRVDWKKATPEFDKQIDTLLQNLAIVKERAASDESKKSVDDRSVSSSSGGRRPWSSSAAPRAAPSRSSTAIRPMPCATRSARPWTG